MKTQEEIYKLKDQGVTFIRIEYSGGGDDGAIDDITYLDNDENIVSVDNIDNNAIEELAYTKLNDIEDWWNNEGGMGTMTINLNDLSYDIHNEIRYTEYETYNHCGSLSDLLDKD